MSAFVRYRMGELSKATHPVLSALLLLGQAANPISDYSATGYFVTMTASPFPPIPFQSFMSDPNPFNIYIAHPIPLTVSDTSLLTLYH
jgi:hypothetical protein